MKLGLLAVLFTALLMAGCLGSGSQLVPKDPVAQNVCNVGLNQQFKFMPDWFFVATMALMVSAALLAVIYMFAMILTAQGLVAFVKVEMIELGITAVIIFALMGIVASLCVFDINDVFPALNKVALFPPAGVSSGNIYDVTFAYYEYLDSRIIGWMTANHLMVMNLDQIASTTIYSKPLGLGMVTSPGAGFAGPLKNILAQMTNAMVVAFIVNHAQLSVLKFMTYSMMNYWLPIGIILRAFTPTRRIGGTLIAIAIGFLLIYPLFTVMTANVVLDQVVSADTDFWATVQKNVVGGTTHQSAFGQIFSKGEDYQQWMANAVSGQLIQTNKNDPKYGQALTPTSIPPGCKTNPISVPAGEEWKCYGPTGQVGIGEMMKGMFSGVAGGVGGFTKDMLFAVVMVPSAAIAMAFTAGIVMPAITVLIFVQAMKALSRALGEEIDITALTRMI